MGQYVRIPLFKTHSKPTNTQSRTPPQAHHPPTPLPPTTPAAKQQTTTATLSPPLPNPATTHPNKAMPLPRQTPRIAASCLRSSKDTHRNRDIRSREDTHHSKDTRNRVVNSRCIISSSRAIRRRDMCSSSRVEVVVLVAFVRVC